MGLCFLLCTEWETITGLWVEGGKWGLSPTGQSSSSPAGELGVGVGSVVNLTIHLLGGCGSTLNL